MSAARAVGRHRDREVEPFPRRVDSAAQRSAGKAEIARQARIRKPDRRGAIGADPPDPRLVVRHVEIAGVVEGEVIPHRLHPVAREARIDRHLGEDLGRGPMLAQVDAKDPAIHVGDIELVARLRVAIEGQSEEAHGRVRHGVDGRRLEEPAGHVVRVDSFVIVVPVAAVRRIGEEVAGARRYVDPAVADGDAEWVARCGRAGEDRDVADRWRRWVLCHGRPDPGAGADRQDRRRGEADDHPAPRGTSSFKGAV